MRREFSRPVKFEILRRATIDGKITCEGCGLVLGAKRFDIDHTIPDALFLDKSRVLTAADGKLLGKDCCHAPKTAEDVRAIAKVKRVEGRHRGIDKAAGFRRPPGSRYDWKRGRYTIGETR